MERRNRAGAKAEAVPEKPTVSERACSALEALRRHRRFLPRRVDLTQVQAELHEIPESDNRDWNEAQNVKSDRPARRLRCANTIDREPDRREFLEYSEKSGRRRKRDADCDEGLQEKGGGKRKRETNRLEA